MPGEAPEPAPTRTRRRSRAEPATQGLPSRRVERLPSAAKVCGPCSSPRALPDSRSECRVADVRGQREEPFGALAIDPEPSAYAAPTPARPAPRRAAPITAQGPLTPDGHRLTKGYPGVHASVANRRQRPWWLDPRRLDPASE